MTMSHLNEGISESLNKYILHLIEGYFSAFEKFFNLHEWVYLNLSEQFFHFLNEGGHVTLQFLNSSLIYSTWMRIPLGVLPVLYFT